MVFGGIVYTALDTDTKRGMESLTLELGRKKVQRHMRISPVLNQSGRDLYAGVPLYTAIEYKNDVKEKRLADSQR